MFSSSFTLAEMARPSATPASCLVAVPITLPMSLAHHLAHVLGACGTHLGDDFAEGSFQFLGRELLGQVVLHHLYLGQFLVGQVLTALLHVDGGGVLALLGQFLDELQGVFVAQGVVGSRMSSLTLSNKLIMLLCFDFVQNVMTPSSSPCCPLSAKATVRSCSALVRMVLRVVLSRR